jgi:putative intracellular protease/amidase
MPRVDLKGMKIAFMMANEGVEQVELTEPWKAVRDAGGQPWRRFLSVGARRAL